MVLAHRMLFFSVKRARDLVSGLLHPHGMTHGGGPGLRVGDHHRHSDHGCRTAFRIIGCSLFSGGVKQFIMSGRVWIFTYPTAWSVHTMVDQLPNRGREAEVTGNGAQLHGGFVLRYPCGVRFTGDLPLPLAQSEEEIISDARRLLGSNIDL